jgi:cell division protein FtsI/penicillin-binding protein 2
VVLDVPSREALALVSYPSYDPAEWDEQYPWLRDDTDRLPLSFRAVANRYAPGSIVKPLVCLAGLVNRRITLDTREDCLGYLDPQHPDRRRCWEIHGTNLRKAHGSIDVVEALTGSCNVFLFRVGERLGVDALCSAFDMACLGRSTGIGLREENPGINPTPDWLMKEKGTEVYPAHAWNFSIGQGELAVTPIQAANLAAIYASGRFRHVSLWRPQASRPEWVLPGTAEQWSAIRRGIFGVVNDPSGTAHDFARFEHERYCLMGKTGSATAHPWPTAYRIPYVDATGQQGTTILRAGAKGPACKRFEAEFPGATYDPDQVSVSATWPREVARDSNYSHAWFAGYLQAVNGQGQPEEWQAPRVAFAVLVEFGGSGGRTSGPLAREIADLLFEYLGPDLALR